MRRLVLGLCCSALLLTGADRAQAACRLALTLALDVSSSVDAVEYQLQLHGLADALQDDDVRRAVFQLPGAHIALQVYEWSDVSDQRVIRGWTEVHSPADLDTIANGLRAHRRAFANGKTALGTALLFGLQQLRSGPVCGLRKIDVSGDGQSNAGIPPQVIYGRHDFGDTTVNGLAIASDEEALARYYQNFVIHGPGAFVEEAADFTDYADAIKRKLIREMGVPQLGYLSDDLR